MVVEVVHRGQTPHSWGNPGAGRGRRRSPVLGIVPGTQASDVHSMTDILTELGRALCQWLKSGLGPQVFRSLRVHLSFLSCPHRPTCPCCSASSSTAQGWPNRTLPSTSPSMNSCFWTPAPPHLLTPQSCFSM